MVSYMALGIAAAMTSFCLWYSSQIWKFKCSKRYNRNMVVTFKSV